MQSRVDYLLEKTKDDDPLRYMVYSAHDDQITNMFEWLNSSNLEMDYFLYAS